MHGNGLLHNDILSCEHSLHCIRVVNMIGVGNVNEISLRFLKHPPVVRIDEPRGSKGLTKVDSMFYAFLACIDACHFNLSGKVLMQHPHDFSDNLSRSCNRYLHSLDITNVTKDAYVAIVAAKLMLFHEKTKQMQRKVEYSYEKKSIVQVCIKHNADYQCRVNMRNLSHSIISLRMRVVLLVTR